ncbi:hypothetical protein GT021_41415 [Streptomyces sp. SID5470]|uniref:Uncharacterized protein n=1 Tax=Streptomyces sviceus (strain ATCC 29083 / DSM 924 / JCM 4929 / NBRC 13980 / NCIMB 11184 / NRRL 5439 / UC 5370) TaxID=463191 RepID=B5HUH1_STRX2|nr:conserved hypothetical protein [Streptomyces sviceus ATCC 29083]MYT10651.1 hypothetical protein [Streptomyces sp. SID5470]
MGCHPAAAAGAGVAFLATTTARYGRVDLLGPNELGCMELARRVGELLFQVLTEREEKTDPRLCAAHST